MISFNKHILECLDITDEWLIDKPGTDPDMCSQLKELKADKPLGDFQVKHNAKNKKAKRIAQSRANYRWKNVESKYTMQARNHNKYKRP